MRSLAKNGRLVPELRTLDSWELCMAFQSRVEYSREEFPLTLQ